MKKTHPLDVIAFFFSNKLGVLRSPLLSVLGISIIYVLGSIWLMDSIIHLVQSAANPFFATFIIFVTILGQGLAIFHAFKLVREVGFVHRIQISLEQISEATSIDREAILRQELGHESSGLAAVPLFETLLATRNRSSGMDRPSLRNQVQAFEDVVARRTSLPNHISSVLIGLGLFGTFLGLIVTLKSVAGLIGLFAVSGNMESADMMGQFFQKMSGPLAGMGEAFVASLLGLGGSMINSLQMLSLKRLQSATVFTTETTFFDLAEILHGPAEHSPGKDSQVDTRVAYLQLEEISGLRRDLNKQTDAILIASSKMRQASDAMAGMLQIVEKIGNQDGSAAQFETVGALLTQSLEAVSLKLNDSHSVQSVMLSTLKDANTSTTELIKQVSLSAQNHSSNLRELTALGAIYAQEGARSREAFQQQTGEIKDELRSNQAAGRQQVEDIKEVLRNNQAASNSAMAESIQLLRDQNTTLHVVSGHAQQTNTQAAKFGGDVTQALEKFQPQLVDLVARLEKNEHNHIYEVEHDWASVLHRLDRLLIEVSKNQSK